MNKYIKLFFVYPTNLDDLKKVEHLALWCLFMAYFFTTLWLLFVYVDKPNANSTLHQRRGELGFLGNKLISSVL